MPQGQSVLKNSYCILFFDVYTKYLEYMVCRYMVYTCTYDDGLSDEVSARRPINITEF